MKKIFIVLLLLIVTMVAGCGSNAQSNKMDKQLIVEHDILGHGNKQTIVLSVYEDTSGAPLSWNITVDGQKMLTLARDDYDAADIKFEDIDGDKRDEILVYRSSSGSAGAVALNVYKPGTGKWIELIALKNSFDLPSKRFKMKYTGNYKVIFEDPETGLKATIPLEKERYKGSENSCPKFIPGLILSQIMNLRTPTGMG